MMMLDHQRGFQDEIRFITLEAQVDTRTRLRVLVRCFVFEFCMLLYFFVWCTGRKSPFYQEPIV